MVLLVIATYEDPFGGWLDNLYGPMSIWDGIGRGVIRTHYGHNDVALDYLPVDLCVRVLLAAGWHRGIGFRTRYRNSLPSLLQRSAFLFHKQNVSVNFPQIAPRKSGRN